MRRTKRSRRAAREDVLAALPFTCVRAISQLAEALMVMNAIDALRHQIKRYAGTRCCELESASGLIELKSELE